MTSVLNVATMEESSHCPVCSTEYADRIRYLNQAYPSARLLHDLEIAICPECGLGAAVPLRSWEQMQSFYREAYRAPGAPFEFPYLYHFDRFSVDDRALSQWLLLKMFRDFSQGDSFCDIGPGKGRTFQTAKYLGLPISMYAYEPDQFSIRHLQRMGVSVIEESFSPESPVPENRFSVVIMSHVLEHFSGSEVCSVIALVNRMLSEDGIFLCEVPNAPMRAQARIRENDSPHLTFWTQRSLKRLAEMNNLEVKYINTAGESFEEFWTWNRDEKRITGSLWAETLKPMKSLLKRVLSSRMAPQKLDDFIRYLRFRQLSRYRRRSDAYDILSRPYFQAGGDRIYLRMVCAKKDTSRAPEK